MKPSPTFWLLSSLRLLSRCGHSVCNAHFALLSLAYELTNSRLSLKISPQEIFSASSPKALGRVELEERRDAGKGERGKAGFALPGPLIYERVANLKIP